MHVARAHVALSRARSRVERALAKLVNPLVSLCHVLAADLTQFAVRLGVGGEILQSGHDFVDLRLQCPEVIDI